jgi:hypothetical protein
MWDSGRSAITPIVASNQKRYYKFVEIFGSTVVFRRVFFTRQTGSIKPVALIAVGLEPVVHVTVKIKFCYLDWTDTL